ncbi:MAG: DUF192 domain-containing protein [Polyangiales bacterium]
MARLLGACLAGVGVLLMGCEGMPTVTIHGPDETLRLRAHVLVAETADERRMGLVGRREMAEGEGLLLLFPLEGEVCITNAEVVFPIDAVFADALGRVVAVERSIAAGDPSLRCHAPVLTVLELTSGAALSVQPHDVLERRP